MWRVDQQTMHSVRGWMKMTLVHANRRNKFVVNCKLLYDDCWAKNSSLSNPDKHDIYPKANK